MSYALKPYPEYKDSGVPWLGEIPAHWMILPHRALFYEVNERNHPEESLLSVTIAQGVMPQQALLANSSKKDSSNLDKSNYKLVEPGDIAYNKMRAWQGALGVSQYRGIVSPAYIVVRSRLKQVSRYYHYLFRTPAFASEAERWSYGITSDQWSLRFEDFKRIYGVLPPLEEQTQIARFLDHLDRLTRRYIRAQRRLIELLTEQKQALIQQAVTRGLDPHVKLKPSGIEWLGEIPEHWDVRRLKRTATLHRGYDLPDQQRELGSYPVVSSGGIIGSHSRAMVKGPGVVTGRYGSTGAIYFIEPDFWPHNTSLYVSDFNGNFPRFIYYLLHVISINAHSGKSAVPGVDRKDLHEIRVAVPGLEEQKAIATMLDDRFRRLDIAIGQTAQQIDLTREYRTRLTADVVTGRLDVRGVSLEVLLPDLDEAGDLGDLDGMEEDAESDGLDTEEMNDADD
jgi:type I restriction enzyme S subunit